MDHFFRTLKLSRRQQSTVEEADGIVEAMEKMSLVPTPVVFPAKYGSVAPIYPETQKCKTDKTQRWRVGLSERICHEWVLESLCGLISSHGWFYILLILSNFEPMGHRSLEHTTENIMQF